MTTAIPIIEVVHRLPGRLRLRLWWLREHAERAAPVADAVSDLPGVIRAEVRRYTGSILVEYDPARADEESIIAAVERVSGGRVASEAEAETIEIDQLARSAYEEGAEIARAATSLIKGLDAEVLHYTEGRADAATLAALAFLGAGAVEVLVSGELPMPPWFQLAWWAFRTFTTLEGEMIESIEHPLERATT